MIWVGSFKSLQTVLGKHRFTGAPLDVHTWVRSEIALISPLVEWLMNLIATIALCGDNDRMYHRIGPIGNGTEEMPRMSASAKIQPDGEGNWIILENGEVRATYPSHVIRLSVLWKAKVRRKSRHRPFDS